MRTTLVSLSIGAVVALIAPVAPASSSTTPTASTARAKLTVSRAKAAVTKEVRSQYRDEIPGRRLSVFCKTPKKKTPTKSQCEWFIQASGSDTNPDCYNDPDICAHPLMGDAVARLLKSGRVIAELL